MGSYSDGEKSSDVFLSDEEALAENFKNVGLKSNDHPDHGGARPLRPYAEDCSYFLRTGTCIFGVGCRYNHPVKRAHLGGRERGKEAIHEDSEGQIECKYYLTPSGCKYGDSCRYRHSKIQSDNAALELNFLGLPIRVGEKECPFYMRNGSCGYGVRCIFHHPDPSCGGSSPHNAALGEESVGQQPDYFSGASNSESIPMNMYGASQSDQASWSPHMPSKWERYQVPTEFNSSHCTHSSSSLPSGFTNSIASFRIEEFPERPGQPECEYFLKTGYCKFKSACRFHHPKDRFPQPEMCMLSDKGLPLRPGKSICRHYKQYGLCKFGPACNFDHPLDLGLTSYLD